MSDETGRGAASCGVHRLADVEAWRRFHDEQHGAGPHPCPWCRINALTREVAELRAQIAALKVP